MQLKKSYHLLIAILVIVFFTLSLSAKTNGNIKIDFSERFRFVSWDNPITLDSSKEKGNSFTRHRTSIGLRWNILKNTTIYFKTTNEFRYYFKPNDKKFNLHEIIVDNLNIKVKNVFKLPVSLTVGRQNIFLGEGFVVLDGSTYDGSRSAYFDAIRADIDFKNGGQLTIFNLYSGRTDKILPIINKKDQLMNEHNLKGFGLYYRGKIKKSKFDLYFINKQSDSKDNGTWNLSVNTIGSAITLVLAKKTDFTTEIAVQSISSNGVKRVSFGAHFHLDQSFSGNGLMKKITLGGIYLSGKNGGWDPMFARWPKWSESYIYTLIKENRLANWSNYSSLYVSSTIGLFRNTLLKTTLNFLGAPEKNSVPIFPGGDGHFRGVMLINRIIFHIRKHFSGHFLWEYFKPGNFYFDNAKSCNWLRFELMYKK